MSADVDRAFARLYTEAKDFARQAEQNGTDYAVARLAWLHEKKPA